MKKKIRLRFYNSLPKKWHQDSLIDETGKEIGNFDYRRWGIELIPQILGIDSSHRSNEGKLQYKNVAIKISWLFWHAEIHFTKRKSNEKESN